MKAPPLFLLLPLALACSAHATVVRPPEFDRLVALSDSVIRGTVTDVRCEWRGDGEDRSIRTIVTIEVLESLVGDSEGAIELDLLGGRIGDDSLVVAGQPHFEVGDEDILFIKGNGVRICPVLAMAYGRYLVVDDAGGRRFVARDNGAPLLAVDETREPLDYRKPAVALALKNAPAALSVEEFSGLIRETARTGRRGDATAR